MLTQKEIDTAISADLPRHQQVAQAWQRYESLWPNSLRPTSSDPKGDDNLSFNVSKVVVDTIAHYLLGLGVDISLGSDSESPEDEWLDNFWSQNVKEQLLIDLAVSGAVSGDAYLMLSGPDATEGEEYPSVTLLDPQHVTVLTDPTDYRKPLAYIISAVTRSPYLAWSLSDGTVRNQTVIEKDESGHWIISRRVADAYRGQFMAQGEPVVWPYPWCPILHCKNLPNPHSFYGLADLGQDVQKANHALNFALSNANRVQRLHGHPKIWAKGVGSDESIDMSPDSVAILESDGANLDQLTAGDLTGHIDYIKMLRELFHQISSVPEIASGKLDNIGQLSGLALKILYGPLVRVIETKRTLYGPLLKEASRRALEMGGILVKTTDISLDWPTILPQDEAATLTTAKAKMDIGIKRDTILRELGYDPVQDAEPNEPVVAIAARPNE